MNIRESMEERELELLCPYAAYSGKSRGRDREEEECDVRTVYQRDRDRILHSKAFRRMKDKTQVFLAPEGDHYRNRLTHTLEVSQIARTIAKALRLNEDLVEAIALGHDLGHTPFGHSGETALNQVHPGGFAHYQQSIRVVEVLEKNGEGLNLILETKDGILNHRTSGSPSTLEGQVVRFSDKIAYVHHDMDDAQRAGIITETDISSGLREFLGQTTRERLNTFVHDVIENSMDKPVHTDVSSCGAGTDGFAPGDVPEGISESHSEKGRVQGYQNADGTLPVLHRPSGGHVQGVPCPDREKGRAQKQGGM